MLIIFLLLALAFQGEAFSIPGVSTGRHPVNNSIQIYANELDSVTTQFNFEHYYLSFCGADQAIKQQQTLGATLLGESTVTTPYFVNMAQNELCKTLCVKENSEDDVEKFKWVIDRNYSVNLIIDGLPVNYQPNKHTHRVGFPVGHYDEETKQYYIYNHLELHIFINVDVDKNNPRVIGFYVIPHSVKTEISEDGLASALCTTQESKKVNFKTVDPQPLEAGKKIAYSYDVKFNTTHVAFGSRWDTYKGMQSDSIHWFSIMNSFIVNCVLFVVICYILKRAKSVNYVLVAELPTHMDPFEDVQEQLDQRSWKQLSREVFRPPNHPLLLSALIGTGVQVGTMFFLTLLSICLGFMKQSHRGSLLTTTILFYNFMGVFAGYYSARIYKMFNGKNWVECSLATALLFSGINFITFYAINIMLIFEESSSAVHTDTILTLVGLWFGISTPLVLLGSLVGYKKQVIVNPCKYNPIPKSIPPRPWYLDVITLCLFGGLLPFGSVFIELVFVMMSIWEHSFYYLFAFLFLTILILLITSAQISIIITHIQLCKGIYKVWWSSFLSSGSCAIYILLYSVFYFCTELNITRFSSISLYFGYMFIISFIFFLFSGTAGFLASYWFTRKIYSAGRSA